MESHPVKSLNTFASAEEVRAGMRKRSVPLLLYLAGGAALVFHESLTLLLPALALGALLAAWISAEPGGLREYIWWLVGVTGFLQLLGCFAHHFLNTPVLNPLLNEESWARAMGLGGLVATAMAAMRGLPAVTLVAAANACFLGRLQVLALLTAFRSSQVSFVIFGRLVKTLRIRGHSGSWQGITLLLGGVVLCFLEFLDAYLVQLERIAPEVIIIRPLIVWQVVPFILFTLLAIMGAIYV